MIYTEEEAKTKMCQEEFGSSNAGALCMGTSCMAWRWMGPASYEYGDPLPVGSEPADPGWEKNGEPYKSYAPLTITEKTMLQRWQRQLPRKGFCGKAGAP